MSFGLSETPNETMVWTLLSLSKDNKFDNLKIPETWKNIREWFSAIVPQVWELPQNTTQLDNIYSHMTIWKKEVIEEIVNQILESYNTTRV